MAMMVQMMAYLKILELELLMTKLEFDNDMENATDR